MKKVTIYTTQFCPYCHRALALLDTKKVEYINIDVSFDPGLRTQMREKSGGINTVPQIFIDEYHVGGSDDLQALERDNKLNDLLGISK